jgi:hypothetical protein
MEKYTSHITKLMTCINNNQSNSSPLVRETTLISTQLFTIKTSEVILHLIILSLLNKEVKINKSITII